MDRVDVIVGVIPMAQVHVIPMAQVHVIETLPSHSYHFVRGLLIHDIYQYTSDDKASVNHHSEVMENQ